MNQWNDKTVNGIIEWPKSWQSKLLVVGIFTVLKHNVADSENKPSHFYNNSTLSHHISPTFINKENNATYIFRKYLWRFAFITSNLYFYLLWKLSLSATNVTSVCMNIPMKCVRRASEWQMHNTCYV